MFAKARPAALIVAAVTGVAGIGVAPAVAGKPGYSMADVKACSHDAITLCHDKLADIKAIESCMRANFDKLRPACQARFNR